MNLIRFSLLLILAGSDLSVTGPDLTMTLEETSAHMFFSWNFLRAFVLHETSSKRADVGRATGACDNR